MSKSTSIYSNFLFGEACPWAKGSPNIFPFFTTPFPERRYHITLHKSRFSSVSSFHLHFTLGDSYMCLTTEQLRCRIPK